MRIPYDISTQNNRLEPEDDIDRLFSHLERLEPPPEVIADVLTTVKLLPLPRPTSNLLPLQKKHHRLLQASFRGPHSFSIDSERASLQD